MENTNKIFINNMQDFKFQVYLNYKEIFQKHAFVNI